VLLRNHAGANVLFPVLYMAPYSNMTFDFDSAATLVVKYRDSFEVHSTSILDFTKITDSTVFKSIAALGYANAVRLGVVKFSKSLEIEVNELHLRNATYDPSISDSSGNLPTVQTVSLE
jgi:hypothetical protein